MMRNLVSYSLCLILAAVLLNACGQKEPEQPPATQAPAAQPATQPTPATPSDEPQTAAAPAQPAPAAQAPAPAAKQPAEATPAAPQAQAPAAPAPQSVPAKPEKLAEDKLHPAEKPAPAKAVPKDVVILKAALGGVRFEHKLHAEARKVACETCHHASRPEKPNAAPQQACSACHTTTATAPMRTKLQAAFHNPTATAGTCIDCHKTEAAKGKPAPVKCLDCHKKENR